MIINNKNLKEVYIPNIWSTRLKDEEHFYAIPTASNYVLSDHATLLRKGDDGKYLRIPMFYSTELFCDAYTMHFDGEDTPRTVSVRKLLAMVFYPDLTSVFLYNPRFCATAENRWYIKDLHVLTTREQIVETFLAKIEHRQPNYDDQLKGATFINRIDKPDISFKKYLQRTCANMIDRATNPKTKAAKPQYLETTIDPEIIEDKTTFFEWALGSYYDYPGADLQIDKDLLSFGELNRYSLKHMCFLPNYINKIFRKLKNGDNLGYGIRQIQSKNKVSYRVCTDKKVPGSDNSSKFKTVDTYAEALHLGRKAQAEYIRKVVAKERADGYIPAHILDTMCTWANMCELGLTRIWEPSAETLSKMGVVY